MDESVLIERLKKKDNLAFKEIVETRHAMIYNTVLGIIQNTGDAEDVAQDVFVQLYESIKDFKGESKISTWLYRIAIFKAMDYLRAKKRKKRFAFIQSIFGNNNELIYDPPDFFHPGVIAENKQDAAALFKAIKKLPRNQQTAFILNKVEGLSYEEIGDVLRVSASAVDSLLQRAKTNLRAYLTGYYKQNFKEQRMY